MGWATTNYYLHKVYPDLFGTEFVSRGLNFLFGTHPAHNYSFVATVGTRSKHLAYGNNRADFSFIAGRRRAGRADPEARLPREHGRLAVPLGRERVRDRLGATYIFLANAAQELLGR